MKLTADQSGIKDYGEEKWGVTGQYAGSRIRRKEVSGVLDRNYSAMFGTLQREQLKLGDRQYDLTAATEKELAVIKTEAGFPSIAGVRQEGPAENQFG